MGWEWNQLTPGSFLISVIGSNPSQKPQGNAGSLNFLETDPMLSLKSVGRFAVPLLEAWEGFNQGHPNLGCTPPAPPFAVGYKGLISPKKNQGLPGQGGHICQLCFHQGQCPQRKKRLRKSMLQDAEIKVISLRKSSKAQKSRSL